MKKLFTEVFPERIGQFTLVDEHSHRTDIQGSNFARYKNSKGKYAFAKLLRNSTKPWESHWITNESEIYPMLNTMKVKGRVSVPHLLASKKTQNGHVLLFEYIHGKTLRDVKNLSAIKIINEVLGYMNSIHVGGSVYSKKTVIPKRHNLYFLCAFPLLLTLTYIKHADLRKQVWSAIKFCVRGLREILFDRDYGFIHRDLNDTNIIISARHIWLIDFQTSLIADRRFELANIAINLWDTHRWSNTFFTQPHVRFILHDSAAFRVFTFFCLFAALYEIVQRKHSVEPWLKSFLLHTINNEHSEVKSV